MEFTITKLIGILLIVIAIIFLLPTTANYLWKTAKIFLGFANYTEVDYGVVNENGISTFDSLSKNINKCLSSKDKNCACEASFLGFYKTHKLESDGAELKLVNIKEGNEITIKKEKIQGLNCYLDGKDISKLDKLEVFFDEDPSYIKLSGLLGIGFLKEDARFDKSLKIYKGNELCWITSKADLTNIKICS